MPVGSADLNAIQDAIVNGLHGTIETPLAPQAFVPAMGSTAVRDDNVVYGAMKLIDINSVIYAPLPIPTSDRITDFLVAWKATDANVYELQWAIDEVVLATGSRNTILASEIITVNVGATYQTFLQSAINFQCSPGCAYYVVCAPQPSGSGHVVVASDAFIVGATVKHDNL